MTPVVILISVLAGFCVGLCHARTWRRREGLERNPIHRPYSPTAFRQNNSLARARRAF
jgi:hypothetical protein